MHPLWRIELLGRLRVEQGEREITRFRTYKTGALLAYLAYYHHRPHPREELIELLWPELEPDAARNNLSKAVSSLRHQLEPPDVEPGSVLLADRTSIGLKAAACSVDSAEFQTALRAAARARTALEQSERLSFATSLYRGDLLPGHYEEWVLGERERLRDLFVQALYALIVHLEQSGDLDAALLLAGRAVAADPLREESHRTLIRLQLAAGQWPIALRRFQELEDILERELGAGPSPAARVLALEIARARGEAMGAKAAASLPAIVVPPVVVAGSPGAGDVSDGTAHLPRGTVTFLAVELSQPEDDARARLRRATRLHQGQELPEGAGCFRAAFTRASDALACILDASRGSVPNRVGRMAMHTGEANPGRHVGGAPESRVLSVARAAHAGQLLCSEAAAALLRGEPDSGASLLELGWYRLNETTPGGPGAVLERLYQVCHPALRRAEFPPPLAAPEHAGNLPLEAGCFFGREKERQQLATLLDPGADRGSRPITITGPGGIGKTRLALAVARRLAAMFRGAVWFVPLEDLAAIGRRHEPVAEAVLAAMRAPAPLEGSPTASRPLERLARALPAEGALLLLDSFEHLLPEGADTVGELLERAPQLRCLVTSRQPLDLPDEYRLLLGPLEFPAVDEGLDPLRRTSPSSAYHPANLLRFPSVQLFIERAQAVRPDFQITTATAAPVGALCARLEGIPLALELAAARASVLSPAQMLARLEPLLELPPSRHHLVRHRTLRAAIGTSYELLSPDAQRLFTRLSIFRGGWTLEAAEEIADFGTSGLPHCNIRNSNSAILDSLSRLSDASLIRGEARGPGMRFGMLEMLREYAAEQLPDDERAPLADRHARYYLALAEEAEQQLTGDDQAAWFDRLDDERANLRSALAWMLEHDPLMALKLAGALGWWWLVRGHWKEGAAALRSAVARSEAQPAGGADSLEARRARVKALKWLRWLLYRQGDIESALPLMQEGLDLCRASGDAAGVADALHDLGAVFRSQGNLDEAAGHAEEALAICRELGDERGTANALNALGVTAALRGDYGAARAHFEQALALFRTRNNRRGVAESLRYLLDVTEALGDDDAARALQEESLAISRELGDHGSIGLCLGHLGVIACRQHRYEEAQRLLEESLAIARELGDLSGAADRLATLGLTACLQGDTRAARRLYEESLRICLNLGEKRSVAGLLEEFAAVFALAARDRPRSSAGRDAAERATKLYAAATALREAIGAPRSPHQHPPEGELLDLLRSTLGTPPFERDWKAGLALDWRDAAAIALEDGVPARCQSSVRPAG